MRKYGESKTTRIMTATVLHVTSGSGLRKFQADGFFFLDRMYNITTNDRSICCCNQLTDSHFFFLILHCCNLYLYSYSLLFHFCHCTNIYAIWLGEKFCNLSSNMLYIFLISNFRRVLNIVCFLLSNSPACVFYMPTFRNTMSVPSSQSGRYEE